VHGCLAGGALILVERFSFAIDPHQILGSEKTQRGMLARDQKIFRPDAVAQVTPPAADEPPFKKHFSPANHLAFEPGHKSAPG